MEKMDEDQKLTMLAMIREKKDLLFAELSSSVTWQKKEAAWDDVASRARAIGIYSKSGRYLRNTTWQNWRKRAVVSDGSH